MNREAIPTPYSFSDIIRAEKRESHPFV